MRAHPLVAGAGTDTRHRQSYRLAACGVAFPVGLAVGVVLGAWASRTLDGRPTGPSAPAAAQVGTAAVPDAWRPPAAAVATGPVAGALGDHEAFYRRYGHTPAAP